MAYDSFAGGLARSPLQRVLLSKIGGSGVPTAQEQQAQKKAANNLWLEAELAGIIVKDPNDADMGYKIDIAALNDPNNKIITKQLGDQIPGFLKYTRKSKRSLRKYPEKYAKGNFGGVDDLGDGTSILKNGAPGSAVGELGIEDEQNFIKFPNKDVEGLGKVMLRNLWVKGKGEMHYFNKARSLAEGMGVDLDELMKLTGAEYEAENAEVERLQGELARVQKSIDRYAADDGDLDPSDIRENVGELLVKEEDIKEQLENSIETLVTASGIDIQTDPISQAKKLEEDRKVRGGDIAEKIMEGVRPPEEVVTDPDAVLEQRAALSRNGDPTHFSENWSTKLSPQSLREQSNRHTDIIKRTEAFPLYGGPIMGSRGSARRVKRASLNIAKKQAQIDTLISQGKAGSPSIQRHKDQMAKDQLYIDKEMMKYEHKKVVTAKGDIPGVGPVTTQTLVSTGDGDNDVENQPPTPTAEDDHINKRAKLDPDKNALEIELKQINAKLIVAKRNLKTPSDIIESKTVALSEKRLVLDELAYNWSLMVNPNATGIVRLNEMRSLINQVTLGLGPAELEAKNNAHKEGLKHTLDMRQHFMKKFEDYNSNVRTHTYNILDVLYDKETGFKGFSPEVMNSFTSNMNSIYSIWEESIDQQADPFAGKDPDTQERLEMTIRQSEDALAELGGHAILLQLRERIEDAGIIEDFDKWWMDAFGYSITEMKNIGGIVDKMNGVFDDNGKLLYVTVGGMGPVFERNQDGSIKRGKDGEPIIDKSKSQGFPTEYLRAKYLNSLFGHKFGWFENYFWRKHQALEAARSQ